MIVDSLTVHSVPIVKFSTQSQVESTPVKLNGKNTITSWKSMKLLPLNPKAQKILTDTMEGNPRVNLLERKGKRILVTSQNGKFCGWVRLAKDRNWDVILW